ncbi:RIP metalloprotease RseP [Erythrobacter dokdonensis]|uniref:Zinc metalloprotease n=2 Tax=Erythrobacter TaxID=1041 RepID=A0A1A7BHF6_9SPHN|nr:RIP metalloprotease RseP [Erythrobacter dokdonensis]OBV11914.1 Site-2 protease, Metallo peptidase, MEROPS family M50B [Erythrobacter dokdonensis DSW-74]
MFETPPFWMYVIGFPLLLGPLVTLHELGHLLVGRWFGVKAEAFSVGFGKELAGFTDRHGTRWKLSALPLGGYVQFQGDMNPASVPDPDAPKEEGSFQHAALWKRALIVAAGPVTNLLVAIAILAAFLAIQGKPVYIDSDEAVTVAYFSEGSTAQAAGMAVGDEILAVDGAPTPTFEQLVQRIALYPGERVTITVRRDGSELALPVTIGRQNTDDGFGNKGDRGVIGVGPAPNELEYEWEPVPLLQTIPLAVEQSGKLVDMMVTGIKQILVGQRSVKELGGPLKIGKVAGERLSLGPSAFIEFAALISLNLAFINFLPIPALDGGHLMFYAAEAIRRKPVGPRATEWAYRTGIALVLTLMVVVTVNDLFSLPLFGS